MTVKKYFTAGEARSVGEQLGIDWSRFNIEHFRMGMDVELEHGLVDPYYTRLYKMEEEAEGGEDPSRDLPDN
jgi:hypothetical protein